jgi:hypothetical protein
MKLQAMQSSPSAQHIVLQRLIRKWKRKSKKYQKAVGDESREAGQATNMPADGMKEKASRSGGMVRRRPKSCSGETV